MPEAALNTSPGWYGKLPNRGDFASRRLPDDFISGWDDWLQQGLACAREDLGEEAWLARYLVAPVLRFWLAPGVLGAVAWTGLLMPSVDRVGRHFPLTVAVPAGLSAGSLAAVLAAADWFSALDGAARQVLDVEFTVEDFEARLATIAVPDFDAAGDAGSPGPQQLASALLQPFMPRQQQAGGPGLPGGPEASPEVPQPCSLWWREGASDAAQFACYPALPPAASFAGLLC
ncbi:MAG TPA: type VI secretion system-associated protein TagF [Methylibium sp.]